MRINVHKSWLSIRIGLFPVLRSLTNDYSLLLLSYSSTQHGRITTHAREDRPHCWEVARGGILRGKNYYGWWIWIRYQVVDTRMGLCTVRWSHLRCIHRRGRENERELVRARWSEESRKFHTVLIFSSKRVSSPFFSELREEVIYYRFLSKIKDHTWNWKLSSNAGLQSFFTVFVLSSVQSPATPNTSMTTNGSDESPWRKRDY